MNILSLFDGISCAQIALNRAGIKYNKYFASENDKYAIKITQKNYPQTIQIGNITDVRAKDLPKIDLVIGGPPCQGFSIAGAGLNFDDPRSKLFFEYVRLLEECKPRYFLMENVKMRKDLQEIISDILNVKPMLINSALVSAQNRQRVYWKNWHCEQPEDKNILLQNIIDNKHIDRNESQTILSTYYKENIKRKKYGLCTMVGEADIKGYESIRRVYAVTGKSPTLQTSSGGHREPKITTDLIVWRKLTPLECERLQTIPDNYTAGVSKTQRYKMLGNAYTVDVIVHLLKAGIES